MGEREDNAKYYGKWHQRCPEKYLLYKAKKNAKLRGCEFNLSLEDIKVPDTCPVLGIPLKIIPGAGLRSYSSPSLDRLDSSKGYVKGNVNVISWRANLLKSNGTLDEFKKLVDWLERIG